MLPVDVQDAGKIETHLLYFRICAHHPAVDICMVAHQYLWIPRRSHKNRINTAANRRHEDLADLQTDQECKRHDHRRVGAASVVGWVCELQVKVRKESTEVTNECRAHGQDRSDQAIIDQGVDSAVFHHGPGVFSCRDVGFAVESYVRESIAVDESIRSISMNLSHNLVDTHCTAH